MAMGDEGPPASDGAEAVTTRYEGYSDYRTVSQRIGRKVSSAQHAFSILHASATEGADIDAEEIAEAKAAILEAAVALNSEIPAVRNGTGELSRIDERWNGEGNNDDDGLIQEFLNYSFTASRGLPDWLYQFAVDIRRAAFELGYLRAGREVDESNLDPVEEDVNAMFEGIQL